MGATNFSTISSGKNISTAYSTAVTNAQYEYGHGGYSGSIAEKDGWVEFPLPARVPAGKFEATVWGALNDKWYAEGATYRGEKPKPSKHLALLEKWLGKQGAQNILAVADDKWGPAVAVRLSKAEGARFIPKTPTGKCKAGFAAYLFFGMASC